MLTLVSRSGGYRFVEKLDVVAGTSTQQVKLDNRSSMVTTYTLTVPGVSEGRYIVYVGGKHNFCDAETVNSVASICTLKKSRAVSYISTIIIFPIRTLDD